MAMTSTLRAALVSKKSWSKQQLSARSRHVTQRLPMALADAHAVIAHREGIKIERFLTPEDLARVQNHIAKLNGMGTNSNAAAAAAPRRRDVTGERRESKASGSRPRTLVFPGTFTLNDPFLPESKAHEAQEMAEVYPLLYVVENSVREVVQRVMRAKYGDDWWNVALNGGRAKQIKVTADQRQKSEGNMSWHQRRGAHAIDYVDLGELRDIVLAKQDDFFPDVLGDNRSWFEQFMRELIPSRNVICHMNPLSKLNIDDVRVKAARWCTLLTERQTRISSPGSHVQEIH